MKVSLEEIQFCFGVSESKKDDAEIVIFPIRTSVMYIILFCQRNVGGSKSLRLIAVFRNYLMEW